MPAGGWFATDPQSQGELRVGPDTISLSADTQINFADLDFALAQQSMRLFAAEVMPAFAPAGSYPKTVTKGPP